MLSGRQNPGCLEEMDGLNSRVLSYTTRHNLTWMLRQDAFDPFFSFVSFVMKTSSDQQTLPKTKKSASRYQQQILVGTENDRRGVRTLMIARCSCTGRNNLRSTLGVGKRRRCQIHLQTGNTKKVDLWVDFALKEKTR